MRLAIVGASARAAAWSAIAAGLDVVAADLFADVDLADRCVATKIDDWPAGFEPWLAQQEIDAWCYTGGLENHPQLVERMSRICRLMGCSANSLVACRSPSGLSDLLNRNRLAAAEVRLAPPTDSDGWLIKPLASGGGLGVEDWHGQSLTKHCYWQQRIRGRSISAACIANGSQAGVLGVTEQIVGRDWTGARPYQYAGSIGPLVLSNETREQIERTASVVAKECGLVGLLGIDFVLDDQQTPWLVEVNPRYTASKELIERLTGFSMIAGHLAACSHGELPATPAWKPGTYGGKLHLFAKQDFVASQLDGHLIADIPMPGTKIASGDPICTLLVETREYNSVETTLREQASELEALVYADPNFDHTH